MDPSPTSTTARVSPDSGLSWTAEGAWPVAPGIHRIPLPLPSDALRAVNVYAVEGPDGLTLVDGGWAIPDARDVLERSLATLGAGTADIRRFLVTHVHRDHYSMAAVLGSELGVEVSLGLAERPTLDILHEGAESGRIWGRRILLSAGAPELVERWEGHVPETVDVGQWRYPDRWLERDCRIDLGDRALDAVHTPGHTPGHFVFADHADRLLFAGDHVLSTITPSIGFVVPPPPDPLGDFMASLTKVRALPDLRLLPAHGPVAESSHARVDELLAHHEDRLRLAALAVDGGLSTAFEVAGALPWTRRERSFDELDLFNQTLATRETFAHLEVLAARRRVRREAAPGGVVTFSPADPEPRPGPGQRAR
jgi:glyoxylase-like metal-dependent hydrolase (beta-lactamase superfamily II)